MLRRVLTAVVAVVLLAGCAGEDDTSSVRSSPTPSVPVATAKPDVKVPAGPAPKSLVQTDLVVGTGALLIPGQVVTVHYVGVTFDDGKEFDASWNDGHTFSFRLGNDEVIRGWDEGVLGMRVGGRRMLVVPPEYGYGAVPGHELQGETLVFVVDVISTGGAPAQVGESDLTQ